MAPAVRRAECAADFRDFHALLVEYEAALPPVLRHGSVPSAGELERNYRGRNAAFLARSDAGAVGCVGVTEFTTQTAVIMRLFVQPERRGAGAARALVTEALRFLREMKYARVVLDTDKEQLSPAYRLYLSLGFTECGPYTPVSYPSPTFMQRTLE